MEHLFLEVTQMADLPVPLVKAMWDDMFGPQLRFEGGSHKLHERKNLNSSKASTRNADLQVAQSVMMEKTNVESANIYGLTT